LVLEVPQDFLEVYVNRRAEDPTTIALWWDKCSLIPAEIEVNPRGWREKFRETCSIGYSLG